MKPTLFGAATAALALALSACDNDSATADATDNATYSLDTGRGQVADVNPVPGDPDLRVSVRDVRQDGGRVFVAVQTEGQFATMDVAAGTSAPPAAPTIEMPVPNAPAGAAAIAAFQDTNGDGRLNFSDGVPTEPYGFSSGIQRGKPDFEQARVSIPDGETETFTVSLKYASAAEGSAPR